MLQLSGKDTDLTARLGKVKDEIGNWHDWTELSAIAKDVLSKCKDCKIVGQIEETAKRKFEKALKGGQQLRTEYFDSGHGKHKSRRRAAAKDGVLQASAKLAA